MTDLWMPDVPIAKIAPRLIDATGRFTSPFTGAMRTVTRTGDRWGFRLDFANLVGVDRARLESVIANMRGAANRLLWSPIDFGVARGSFPDNELLANSAFANGTTGWTASASTTISASDRLLRSQRTAVVGTTLFLQQTPTTVVQYAPHACRAMVLPGRGNFASGFDVSPGSLTASFLGSYGLLTRVYVPLAASDDFRVQDLSASGIIAGDYVLIPYTSLSRCALIDNAPNLLQQSNAPGTSPWVLTNATVTASGSTAPDGTTSAQNLRENTTNGTHNTQQAFTVSAAAADYSLSVYVQASSRTWMLLRLFEGTGGTSAQVSFNAATGALGTTFVGTNWANLRTFSENCGNGWFRFSIVATKTNAATALQAFIYPESVDNVTAYTGVGTNTALLLWQAVAAQSSVPTMRSPTAGSANAGTLQAGSAYNIKGLPISTSGLVLPGDWVEINKELKRATAPLTSDASGLGYLQFSPPIRTPAADNDPVIVNMPMGRFVLSTAETGWETEPGLSSTSSLDLIEAA